MSCSLCSLIRETNNSTYIAKLQYGTLFLNWNQIYPGRLMYIYHKHVKDITEIEENELAAVEIEVVKVAKCIKKLYNPALINIASLGNHVQHLHWHIIPRYKTDKNWGSPPWPHDDYFPNEAEKAQRSAEIREALFKEGIITQQNSKDFLYTYFQNYPKIIFSGVV